MRRRRKVKIVATLGPASSEPDMMRRLFEAGADVFRINMSHTSHELLAALVERIRRIETELGRPIGALADLQGPKLRIGEIGGGSVLLEEGREFVLDGDPSPGTAERVHLPHPEILSALAAGHALLLDDGRLRLRVENRMADKVVARIEVGGRLSSRKGVSMPDTIVPVSAVTPKDRADLERALEVGVDWIGLSFVQRPEDVAEARKVTRGRAAVMVKVEKPQAVARLDEILDICDGLMVARGDLGVEMPLEKVPGIQKRITRMARRAGKPVVVATQMLESMVGSPVPTRAEVSDVANAVFEGADAVMLSAESAAGAYPAEAVATMDRIAVEVEAERHYRAIIDAQHATPEPTAPDPISAAARQVAETLNTAAVVCWTSSGATGLRMARERPVTPILALTPRPETARRVAVVWGLHSVLTEDAHDVDDVVDRACRIAFREGFAKPGQRILVTAGMPLGTPGATNALRIAFVGQSAADEI